MSLFSALTPAYLRQSFGAQTYARAREYLGRISALEVVGDTVRAQVAGSASQPYRLEVSLRPGRLGPPAIKSWCSCPMGGHCKHVAAVLLHQIAQLPGNSTLPDSPLQQWLQALGNSLHTPARPVGKAAPQLYYQLERQPYQAEYGVQLYKGNLVDGRLSEAAHRWDNIYQALVKPPQFLTAEDLPILRLLDSYCRPVLAGQPRPLRGGNGALVLQMMLDSGRLLLDGRPLQAGAVRPATIRWQVNLQERLYPALVTEPPATHLLPLDPPWYLDATLHVAGIARSSLPANVLRPLLEAPPLARDDIALVAQELGKLLPGLPLPETRQLDELRVISSAPRGVLELDTIDVSSQFLLPPRLRQISAMAFDYALATLHYEDVALPSHYGGELAPAADGSVVRIKRQKKTEQRLLAALEKSGLMPAKDLHYLVKDRLPPHALKLAPSLDWETFMDNALPKLQQAGWEIRYAPAFRHRRLEVESWHLEVEESTDGWLDLDMGIVVEGRRLPLAPLLADLFQRDERWLDGIRLQRIADREKVELHNDEGQVIRVTAERLKPIAATLMDLFGSHKAPERLRLNRFDAPRLTELAADTARWQFKGADAVQQIARRLQTSGSLQAIAPPTTFQGSLRDYQQQGLAWLQHLRQAELSGILADDMGLGKTAQAIAHLLLEKESGRMDRPALIVLPTSLVFNWKSELARFAPGLSVLCLHGMTRKERFADIVNHDVVLTTYPLLWRDIEKLRRYDYHLLILDEAQYVKNATSKSAAAIRQLRARHRLCLTGTPLENHLGELWAQFDFLMPGFLGDSKSFTRQWRTPIEKQGDPVRLDLLQKRVRPFILRRRKEDVVRELPEKTIIVRAVELEGMQRDLYETVRSAMDARVRQEIATKGLQRSQIVILDALLKLRQVCCDPRLLKSAHAKKVTHSAKLGLLMDMVPEMVEEGRRILIFSQLTEMLGLIQAALDAAGIRYVKLTGQTRDRETPVREFQAGKVPVFLISLKAGGVGLNLTAADTVIHYDPWWNPAAENQATDRAHRLGQNKAVFVYKLTVAGSIEERMLALQERKSRLASGILGHDEQVELKFSAEEIAALLAPLPES